jgi:putative CocE/NonD family hydrolase
VRVLYLAFAACLGLSASTKPAIKQLHVFIPMRDGVKLAANVFLPDEPARRPVILERTPYGKTDLGTNYEFFVNHGYVVVVQDVRGRYESEGSFTPMRQEPNDGDDTLNWIARQPWSDGKIGMIGGSYRGIVQWKVAILNNPHLKAIFPVVSGYDDYRDRFFSTGGAFKLGHRLEWLSENVKAPGFKPDFSKYILHLPLRSSDIAATGWTSELYREVMAHPAFDSYWRSISVKEQIQKVRVPVFSVGGWYDNYVQSDLEAYAALHKSSGLNRILIGPWPHNMSITFANTDFGPESMQPIRALQLAWFDQWLMGKDSLMVSQPPVKIFVMGSNKWLDTREWPPENARSTKFFLTSGGKANTLDGDGELAEKPSSKPGEDHYLFDPRDPAPTRGGSICCNPKVFPWGPMDQRPVEQRKDVLVFSTKPLKRDLEVVGPVQVDLYVATSAKDTDFSAKLVDVFPDGYARNLTDGLLRLRYRNSLSTPELAKGGEVYHITVDAGVTSNVFLKGHRIRLEISSSNFPRFDRNPNTGGSIPDETRLLTANQTIFHDRTRPSSLMLMVMPPESGQTAKHGTIEKNALVPGHSAIPVDRRR